MHPHQAALDAHQPTLSKSAMEGWRKTGSWRKQLNDQDFLHIRTAIANETHPHHKDRAGACCSLAVLLWVAHRLVVIGLVEGVQRGVDQVDHQHGVHLAKELTYLDEQTRRCKQTLNREQERLRTGGRYCKFCLLRKAFSGCFAHPFIRMLHSWSRTITFYRTCVCTLNSRELWRRRWSLFNLSSTEF